MAEPLFHLGAHGLLSKWGNGDGDALGEWWWDRFDADPSFDEHFTLRALVREHLLPVLEATGHQVVVYDIETIHNPIRASKVDGRDVDDYHPDYSLLPDLEVSLTVEQILTAAGDQDGACLMCAEGHRRPNRHTGPHVLAAAPEAILGFDVASGAAAIATRVDGHLHVEVIRDA